MKLSILIPHTTKYVGFLERLEACLAPQIAGRSDIEVIKFIDDGQRSIGAKRNWLLCKAKGEYVSFIDSDDLVSNHYIEKIIDGIEKGVDCCSLTGIITEDGKNSQVFQHSIKYKEYKTNPQSEVIRYERFPNHLNTIKASIAKQFQFPQIDHGEDTAWATKLHKSGMIKTEHWIEDVIYFYEYRSKK